MPNRTNVPTPPANQARSTLQVVSYAAQSDQYTLVVDLNDGSGTSWSVVPGTFKLGTPDKKYVESDNIRAPGTSVVKQQYGNMKVSATFTLRGSSVADIIAKVRALVQAIDNPKASPYALRIALPQATQYSYAWVLKCKHDVPLGDTRKLIQQALTGITIVWDCAPGYLGDRLTLQNLAVNPGFEQAMGGGTAQTASQVFSDPLANFNAYSVQAGGALAQDLVFYPDVVQADAPLHYYRLDEPSGASAFDAGSISGTGSYLNTPTLGAGSLLTGDADTAVTFAAASSQRLSVPSAGLPAGNNPVTADGLVKITANPASQQTFFSYGNQSKTNLQNIELSIDTSGRVVADVGGATLITSAALTLNVAHYVSIRWDGTTLTLNVDAAAKQTATPGALNFTAGTFAVALAAGPGGGAFFSGTLDEWAIYGTALSDARVAAHQSAAANAPGGSFASSLKIPSGGRVSFGSPAWGAYQTWQVRWRYLAGLTASFYLHYTDASNNLRFDVASGANGIKLVQRISGVDNVLAQATAGLAGLNNGTHYWAKVTQFPTVPSGVGGVGDPPYLVAEVHLDLAGVLSANTVASLSAPAADALTALVGQPQIAAAGAALGLGGGFSNQHAVWLFGPGGWFTVDTGTGETSGAWETDTTKTYPSGPVTSFGAARIDCAPAGTVSALWTHYSGGAPTASNAIQAFAGQIVAAAAQVKSSGLGVAATLALKLAEYDNLGNLLRTTLIASLTGNQASWTALAGTLTLGAFTAFIAVQLAAVDATSGSANATVWFDNVSVWNKTTTAQDSMPYCELRFPNSPATLMVSGVQGDLAAPAWLAAGTYLASWPQGGTLGLAVGRRPRADANAILAGSCNGFYGTALAPQATAVLDGTAFGGFYPTVTLPSGGWNPRAFSLKAGDAPGQYHLLGRFFSAQSSGNLGNISARVASYQGYSPWYGTLSNSDVLAVAYSPLLNGPLAASSAWTMVDAGLCPLPPFPAGGLADLTQTYVIPRQQWGDSSGVSALARANWNLLLPVDGSLLLATVNNPANSIGALLSTWLWVYADPLAGGGPMPQSAAWLYSQGNAPQGSSPNPQPNVAAGSVGTQTTGQINVNPAADPFLTLDPALDTGTAAAQLGVNQLGAVIYDQAASVLSLLCEVQYTPAYLYPR